jgi:hypothetical protein
MLIEDGSEDTARTAVLSGRAALTAAMSQRDGSRLPPQ